jgi:glutamate synthase domain-containing protein 1
MDLLDSTGVSIARSYRLAPPCGVWFLARLGSVGSHEIVELALTDLDRLTHRGGVDSGRLSGDGAGLLLHS